MMTAISARKILVSDFDGTMTRHDFYDLVCERFPETQSHVFWQQYIDGKCTHFEALAQIFSRIRCPESVLWEVMDDMELDPALPEVLQTLQAHGWQVKVASAGCAWYIDRLFKRAGISLEVHANAGVFTPETGLTLSLPVHDPFLLRETGVDKCGIVQHALDNADVVAFAGDGRPDLSSALLVKPGMRFARGWLSGALSEQGEGYHPFSSWTQILEQLTQ